MGRIICLQPCTTFPSTSSITIPLMNSDIAPASSTFEITSNCAGCEFSANLLLQLNPLLAGLGIPICILGCLGSVLGVVKAIPDCLGPPPDPTKIIDALANVAVKCECLVQFALPPPIGVICDFLKMIAGIIGLVDTIVDCLVGLITSLLTISVKASIALGSPETSDAGECLQNSIQHLMDALGGKLGNVETLFQAIQPIIAFIGSVTPPPFSTIMNQLSTGFASFSASIPPGTIPSAFMQELKTFQKVIDGVNMAFQEVVAICP